VTTRVIPPEGWISNGGPTYFDLQTPASKRERKHYMNPLVLGELCLVFVTSC